MIIIKPVFGLVLLGIYDKIRALLANMSGKRMATYYIGDVHGCYNELMLLMDEIAYNKDSDKLVFVGDLINRGDDSLNVLNFIMEQGDSAQCVLGNHDISLLAYVAGVSMGSQPKFEEILSSPKREEILTWLITRPLLIHDEENLIIATHAGIPPAWSVFLAIKRARKAEEKLKLSESSDWLKYAYSNQVNHWDAQASSKDKFTFTLNALLRMRYCYSDGALDFFNKTSPLSKKSIRNLRPWFDLRKAEDKYSLVFGHWASLGLYQKNNMYGIDTGCVWGKKLTALRCCDGKREIISINSPRRIDTK